jgi:hypothetical protein
MASVEDVANALSLLIQTAAYPTGINNPSVANVDITICFGWPIPAVLDELILAGKALVSIYPNPVERNESRGLGGVWEEYSVDSENGNGVGTREIKRQVKTFQITTWAPTPEIRGLISNAIDVILSDSIRLVLPDSAGNMKYLRTTLLDDLEKEGIYRCELFYDVEFPTVKSETFDIVEHNTVNVKNWENITIATKTT